MLAYIKNISYLCINKIKEIKIMIKLSKVRRMKVFDDREFERLLKSNGYYLDRQKGDHKIYINDSGRHITVKYPINPCISRRLIKEYGLI